MDYFHTISALYHKLLDYFINVIGIIFVLLEYCYLILFSPPAEAGGYSI